jgi:hypothetical protein
MQQPHLIGYADIAEVRTVTGAATCNQLLADGWVLLGIYPLTTVREMGSLGEQEQKQPQDTQAKTPDHQLEPFQTRFSSFPIQLSSSSTLP